jgi:hypothetical protein
MLRLPPQSQQSPFCHCSTRSYRGPILAAIKVVGLVGFNGPRPFNTNERKNYGHVDSTSRRRSADDRTRLRANSLLTGNPVVASGIANQGINEGRGGFLQLLAAVSSALHHGKSSRECYDDTSKSIRIDR